MTDAKQAKERAGKEDNFRVVRRLEQTAATLRYHHATSSCRKGTGLYVQPFEYSSAKP
jgi:hypothetical protein